MHQYSAERNLDYPLCGLSDYIENLCVGDIIGVVLKMDTQIEDEFPLINAK